MRVVIDTNSVPWARSPQPEVWRRMLERAGAEAGRATSIVRYEPGSQFHPHQHPLGEEFFVLDGGFSDEYGDYPAGTYVLNPPGAEHAPANSEGCVLFVKLCQYAGPDRERIVLNTGRMQWRKGPAPGIWVKRLYSSPSHPEHVALARWERGARCPHNEHIGGEEFLVLDGALIDEMGRYPRGTWVRNPHGSVHTPLSPGGCLLLLKTGGVY